MHSRDKSLEKPRLPSAHFKVGVGDKVLRKG